MFLWHIVFYQHKRRAAYKILKHLLFTKMCLSSRMKFSTLESTTKPLSMNLYISGGLPNSTRGPYIQRHLPGLWGLIPFMYLLCLAYLLLKGIWSVLCIIMCMCVHMCVFSITVRWNLKFIFSVQILWALDSTLVPKILKWDVGKFWKIKWYSSTCSNLNITHLYYYISIVYLKKNLMHIISVMQKVPKSLAGSYLQFLNYRIHFFNNFYFFSIIKVIKK